jgi:hypothetical protein
MCDTVGLVRNHSTSGLWMGTVVLPWAFSALQIIFLFFCKNRICKRLLSRSSGLEELLVQDTRGLGWPGVAVSCKRKSDYALC